MADVTKDLLIKISTEGGDTIDGALNKTGASLEDMAWKIIGVNSAWDLFNKVIGVARTGIGYAIDAFSSMMEVSSTFEQLGIRLETIFGGGGPAEKALSWANDFAAKTPLTLQDVTEKMIRLKAYGFDPMSGMLETLANASYAVGTDFNGIVTALGQMELKGKVVQQELNQLSERNIPAIRWLQEELGLTAAQMGDIGNQAISSDRAIEIILRRMNEEYSGALKKAGDTWAGSISTIQDIFMLFQKKIMDNGPWEFLITNIRSVRDAFSEWATGTDGANFAFTAGGIITTHLNNWKAVIIDYIVPNLGKMWDIAMNTAKTFGVIWNIFVDIGIALVEIVAGWGEILGITSDWVLGVNTVYELFGMLRARLIPAIIEGIGSIVTGVQKLWIQMYDGAQQALNGIEALFGKFLSITGAGFSQMSDAPIFGSFFKMIGENMSFTAESLMIDALDRSATIARATATAYDDLKIQREFFKEWGEGTSKDLKGWAALANTLKIDLANPFGAQGLADSAGKEARLLWEQGVNQQTKGATLYDIEGKVGLEKVTDQFGNKKYEDQEKGVLGATKDKNAIQLIPPPGDDMMTIMVKYLNMCIKTEGTIGAGF